MSKHTPETLIESALTLIFGMALLAGIWIVGVALGME